MKSEMTLKSDNALASFASQLSQVDREDYTKIFNRFDFNSIDFGLYESWSLEGYTRNCLFKDDKFELLLICWGPNQETSVHNHDGEDCWVHLITGEIEENFYKFDELANLVKFKSQIVVETTTSFINDKIGLHKLRNNSEGKTMSLHLYAKPIRSCRSYCERSGEFEVKIMGYNSQPKVN